MAFSFLALMFTSNQAFHSPSLPALAQRSFFYFFLKKILCFILVDFTFLSAILISTYFFSFPYIPDMDHRIKTNFTQPFSRLVTRCFGWPHLFLILFFFFSYSFLSLLIFFVAHFFFQKQLFYYEVSCFRSCTTTYLWYFFLFSPLSIAPQLK